MTVVAESTPPTIQLPDLLFIALLAVIIGTCIFVFWSSSWPKTIMYALLGVVLAGALINSLIPAPPAGPAGCPDRPELTVKADNFEAKAQDNKRLDTQPTFHIQPPASITLTNHTFHCIDDCDIFRITNQTILEPRETPNEFLYLEHCPENQTFYVAGSYANQTDRNVC